MQQNTSIATKANYCGIDIIKFLMSICVVAIHTNPLYYCNNIYLNAVYNAVVQQAVPFFFMASGYLLFLKFDDNLFSAKNIDLLKKYIKSFSKIYVTWHLIYLPISLFGLFQNGLPNLNEVIRIFANYLFVGEQWNSWPLWYILATIYAALFLLLCIKTKISERNIYFLSAFVYIITLLIPYIFDYMSPSSQIFKLFSIVFNSTFITSRIFRGIICIPIGMFFARKKISLSKKSSLILLVIVTLALILLQVKKATIFYDITEIICGALLFLFSLKFFENKKSKLCTKLRLSSSVFYYTHMIWYTIAWIIYNYVFSKPPFGMIIFLFVIIFSSLTAIIVEKNKHNKLIKKIF